MVLNKEQEEYLDELAHKVIGCAYEVSNVLGSGFLEKVYENALVHELRLKGFKAEQQVKIPVSYKGIPVGDYYADILVEDCLILELKCVEMLASVHKSQVINYLRATGLHLALILNFQASKVVWHRVVLDF